MVAEPVKEWDGTAVQAWLESRIVAARRDQVTAERGGRDRQDDCDKATAEEMVCSLVKGAKSISGADTFLAALRALLEKDDYVWRGVYDDTRFDRHVRTYIRKLVKMAKANEGFGNITHYQ